ncbi:MAG: glucoamylase family protein, partial [Aridibacter sp.]
DKIADRVDYKWMQGENQYILSHGWKPESGFLKADWDNYSEQMILYILAIGSKTHPISPNAWWAWERTWEEYGGYRYLSAVSPLFIHQYSHAFVDFRNRRETRPPFVNYFENSIKATRSQQKFSAEVLSKEFPKYSPTMWGLSASDSKNGYVTWGVPPNDKRIDGSVVPYAVAGSLMFTPDITLPTLKEMKAKYGDKVYGKYSFADAFNPNTGWVDGDVLGIDLGISLLSAENLRTGKVWYWFMQNDDARRAFKLIGLN